MLNCKKTAEILLWEKNEKPKHLKYKHVMFCLTAAHHKRWVLSNVIAKLGKKLGPFKDEDTAVAAT